MAPEDRARVEQVVAFAFLGLHHVDNLRFYGTYATCGTHGLGLSTWDYNILTRLVVAAHDQCVRVDVHAAGMQLRILLSPRHQRDGDIVVRHPTLDAALTLMKGPREVWMPTEGSAANGEDQP